MGDDEVRELASNLEAAMRENEQLTKLLTADAVLAGCVAEIKRQNAEIEALRERVAGLMEEKNLAIRAARSTKKGRA